MPRAAAHQLVRRFKLPFIAAMLLMSLLAVPVGVGAQAVDAGDSDDVVLTHRLFDEVLSGGSAAASVGLIADDVTLLTPDGAYAGPAGLDAYLSTLRAPFGDLGFKVVSVHAYGNETYGRVTVAEWTLTGHVGQVSPAVTLRGLSVVTTGNGRIAHVSLHYDRVDLASQIEIARYTEMEYARHQPIGGDIQVASDGDASVPPVAGVQEAPTTDQTSEDMVPISRGNPR
jgi:hypothetical protein